MTKEKTNQDKERLHQRNKNREPYDLKALIVVQPELQQFVKPNKYGNDSVDFANPIAVKLLNKALLHHYYGIKNWEFPDENLCPPVPGRADYIHHIADVLCQSNYGKIPTGDKVSCLDIGVGANCIYPILGVVEYGWSFIGTDSNPKSVATAQHIIVSNAQLADKVELRHQKNPAAVFNGILSKTEKIDLSICNPPFHASSQDAKKGSLRKVKNLSGQNVKSPILNFAGISKELICDGGEQQFIENMILESKLFSKNCFWFSTLVSKQSHLKRIYQLLQEAETVEVKTISMGTGNKSTRIVAWTYLTKEDQKEWRETRWKVVATKNGTPTQD